MSRWRWGALGIGGLSLLVFAVSDRTRFITGGALVNLGYRLQDRLEEFDFAHGQEVTPEEVWQEVQRQNMLAAQVRKRFPRTFHHPLVAAVVCMDARLDTNEVLGDTRRYYYVLRTAGSVLSDQEEDMLELAVENGVKLVLLTTHTDCAAEKAASKPESRARFPALARAVDERESRIRDLLARPAIRDRIAKGVLLVKRMNLDTMTEELIPPVEHGLQAR